MVAVQMEVIMADQERSKAEDVILRLRGVQQGDLEADRSGRIRLKQARCAPKAELPPMRNLRPEGARAEEGQEAPTCEEDMQEAGKADDNGQESGQELRGQAPSEGPD